MVQLSLLSVKEPFAVSAVERINSSVGSHMIIEITFLLEFLLASGATIFSVLIF